MADATQQRPIRDALVRKIDTHINNLLHGKNYLVDQKAFMAHLQRQTLVSMTVNAGLVAIFRPRSSKKISFTAFTTAWFASMGRALSYTTTTRLLENICIRLFSPRVAGALLKDVSKSALRKFARYQKESIVASLIFHTTFRASLLPNIAVMIVEQTIDMIWRPKNTWYNHLEKHFQQCLAAIVGASLGAAFGSLIAPGDFTLFGAAMGEAIAYGSLGIQTFLFKDLTIAKGYLWRFGSFQLYLE